MLLGLHTHPPLGTGTTRPGAHYIPTPVLLPLYADPAQGWCVAAPRSSHAGSGAAAGSPLSYAPAPLFPAGRALGSSTPATRAPVPGPRHHEVPLSSDFPLGGDREDMSGPHWGHAHLWPPRWKRSGQRGNVRPEARSSPQQTQSVPSAGDPAGSENQWGIVSKAHRTHEPSQSV